jgi:UDP-N-acetylmuramoylalanine--D-glutamate ligase
MTNEKAADRKLNFEGEDVVLVIGLGASGRATCAIMHGRGAKVYVTDENPLVSLEPLPEDSGGGVTWEPRFVAPDDLASILSSVTVAVLSPGVPLNRPLVRRVQDAGIPVFSEIEVAYRLCKAPIVAITGTKGKTTTTMLVGHMFRRAGKTTYVGGNIGNALIAETPQASHDSWVVAEVSSFQLESIRSFKPRVSAILNISPDHLDRYYSMDEYVEAKFRIFANQGPGDTFVGNLDDPWISRLARTSGDTGGRLHCRTLWYARERQPNAVLFVHDEAIVYAPPGDEGRTVEIAPLSEIPLAGMHNVDNVLAATLIGLAAGLDPQTLRAAIRDFEALPHRLQRIAEIDGVVYVDDSKATNPGSVIAALHSYSQRIVLIAGGRSKGTDFAALGKTINERARAVVLIGEAADEIASKIERTIVKRASSMDDAVTQAAVLAKPGDLILLSPGCASFDMFKSAEARGDAFIRAVARRLQATHGDTTRA